jgi:hypothetical protein
MSPHVHNGAKDLIESDGGEDGELRELPKCFEGIDLRI